MGVIVDSYCYSSADVAAQVFNSRSTRFMGMSTGWGEVVASSDGSLVSIVYHYNPTGGLRVDTPIEYMPACTQVGPLNSSVEFDPSTMNPADVFNSIGSGFLLVAIPLSVIWAGRYFLKSINLRF